MNLISVVVPAYQEQEVVALFYRELMEELKKLTQYQFEVLFVDDGSTDATVDIIREMAQADEASRILVKILSFSRNFGHQFALTCGLDAAGGAAVITMDADLQHPPQLIGKMLAQWEQGYDIVYTVRAAPQQGFLKKLTSRLFYKIINVLSEIPINQDAADFRLMSRNVVDVFKEEIRERDRFLRGLVNWVGFRAVSISFVPQPRAAGKSKYSFKKMWKLASAGLISFSTVPLRLGIYIGIAMGAVSIAYGLYAFIVFLTTNRAVSGWTSLVIYLSAISALLFLLLGLIGIYIGHIFGEIKQRPLYIVRSAYTFHESNDSSSAERETVNAE